MDQLEIRWRRPRRAQAVPELDQYPATPVVANPYPGWLPHFEPTRKTRRALRTEPEHNVYPLTPPYIAWVAHFEATRNRTTRVNRLVQELNNYPVTPQGYYSGFYPGSKAVEVIRTRFDISLQSVQELNQYPSAPVSADVTAWIPHFEKTRNRTNRKLQNLELNSYPATPAGYYTGYYPGSGLPLSNKISFNINIKTVELDEYPVPPVSVAVLPAVITHFERTRNKTNRLLQETPLMRFPIKADFKAGTIFGAQSLIESTFGITSLIYNTKGAQSEITDNHGDNSAI